MRADVAAEITKDIFDKSCFLSVLVCHYLLLFAAFWCFAESLHARLSVWTEQIRRCQVSACFYLWGVQYALLILCTSLHTMYAAVTVLPTTHLTWLGSAHKVCTRSLCRIHDLHKLCVLPYKPERQQEGEGLQGVFKVSSGCCQLPFCSMG